MYKILVRSVGSLFLMLLIASGGIFPAGAAQQITMTYNIAQFLPVDDGTIYDYSPFDGVGDIVDHEETVVAFLNQGILENRGAMEFDLRSIPAGSVIESASLNVIPIGTAWLPGTSSIPVQVFGYVGNGVVEPGDFDNGVAITTFDALAVPTYVLLSLDVTGFLQDHVPVNYVGFSLRTNVHGAQANFGSLEYYGAAYLEITYTPGLVEVDIDIKPGSDENPINTKSMGTIPVAILSTADFDAPSMVDSASLTFGKTGDETSLAFCNDVAEDVNENGLTDLVCHFYTQTTGFQVGDIEGILKGQTIDGISIEGSNSVNILK